MILRLFFDSFNGSLRIFNASKLLQQKTLKPQIFIFICQMLILAVKLQIGIYSLWKGKMTVIKLRLNICLYLSSFCCEFYKLKAFVTISWTIELDFQLLPPFDSLKMCGTIQNKSINLIKIFSLPFRKMVDVQWIDFDFNISKRMDVYGFWESENSALRSLQSNQRERKQRKFDFRNSITRSK